jgi:hypothetical protein
MPPRGRSIAPTPASTHKPPIRAKWTIWRAHQAPDQSGSGL